MAPGARAKMYASAVTTGGGTPAIVAPATTSQEQRRRPPHVRHRGEPRACRRPSPARPHLVPTKGRPGFFCDMWTSYADGFSVGLAAAILDGSTWGPPELRRRSIHDGLFGPSAQVYTDGFLLRRR